MASNIKKVFGIMNKKKPDDSDDDSISYADPTILHSTEPPKGHRGPPPLYPPPRPQHSPNPQRKSSQAADTTSGINKRLQTNDNTKRNSAPVFGEQPKRAPPRPNCQNITKKNSDDDYCDPVDIQRKEDYLPDKTDKAKDDYCEPWDSTTKTEFKNVSPNDVSDDEYMDPYDSGKQGIMEKRISRGLGKDGKPLNNEQQRKSVSDADSRVYDQVYEPSMKPATDDYDMPWEWKKAQNMAKLKLPRPKSAATQNNLPKPGSAAGDDYDEPWENKQGYLLQNQLTSGGVKSRSPVPLPRTSFVPPNQEPSQVYERPWDPAQPNDANIPTDQGSSALYETPWENQQINGSHKVRDASPRRASQPSIPSSRVAQNRKSSQPTIQNSDNYDTPWEYKTPKQFGGIPLPKPPQLNGASEVDPDLPLDDQSWYHGALKRLQAEELLRDAPDCSYLVRNSESSKKDFSLSMKNNDNFLHLKIVRQIDGQFILGQFSKPFMDIPKVISHYSQNKLNIRGAEHKFLKNPISSQPEYHTIEPDDNSHL